MDGDMCAIAVGCGLAAGVTRGECSGGKKTGYIRTKLMVKRTRASAPCGITKRDPPMQASDSMLGACILLACLGRDGLLLPCVC